MKQEQIYETFFKQVKFYPKFAYDGTITWDTFPIKKDKCTLIFNKDKTVTIMFGKNTVTAKITKSNINLVDNKYKLALTISYIKGKKVTEGLVQFEHKLFY